MNKGLALNIVVAMIIAFIGVAVLIGLITTDMSNILNTIYCNTFVGLINLIPFVEGPGTPESCLLENPTINIDIIHENDNKLVARHLLGDIIVCWNNIETYLVERNISCFELHLSGKVENVTEYNVSQILKKEDHCRSIENSDYGCGAKNQIIWNIEGDIISLNKSIMAYTINNATTPSPIPVNSTMIPGLSKLTKKSELKNYLKNNIPNNICNSINIIPNMTCSYILKTDNIIFNITNLTAKISHSYSYNINEVTSDLEKKGNIYSPINTHRVLLIKYDYSKEAIVVVG